MNYTLIEFEKTGIFNLNVADCVQDLEEYTRAAFEKIETDTVVFSIILELSLDDARLIKNLFDSYAKILKEKYGVQKVLLLTHEWYKIKFKNIQFQYIDDMLYVNSFIYWCYYNVIKQKKCKHVRNYTLNAETKFLFLTGKPEKIQRSGLLYKIYKNSLIEHANYSFVIHNKEIEDLCVNTIKNISEDSEDDIRHFLKNYQNTLDRPDIKKVNTIETHYSPIPFDKSMFAKSNFQVITETYYNYSQGYVISEKTWLSILNFRPFILVGEEGILDELKRMGFRTFENYLPYENYNEVKENRLDVICKNIEHWVKNIRNYYSHIAKDTAHNFVNFIKYSKNQEKNLENFIKKHNLTGNPEDLVPGYFTLPRI